MTAVVTTIQRRQFGLAREVHIARCGDCRWRAEVRELGTAVALVRNHQCTDKQETR